MVLSLRGCPSFKTAASRIRPQAFSLGGGAFPASFRRMLAPLFLGALMLGHGGPAMAQGVVKSTFDEWQIRCDTPPGAQSEQCVLIKSVVSDDQPNVGLTVIVLRAADDKTPILRVLAPLGVLLPARLGLKIDGQDVGSVDFVRCLPSGCVAEAKLDDSLLARLRGGQRAYFLIFQTPPPDPGIAIPLELKGFGAGFDALK